MERGLELIVSEPAEGIQGFLEGPRAEEGPTCSLPVGYQLEGPVERALVGWVAVAVLLQYV